MATEYSIQKMVSDGTLSTITLGIQYLQRNDIYMRIAGEETPQSGAPSGYTWSFLDNTTLKILPVVPNGVEVVVYRRTDVDAMYNIYSQNAQFDEATIDENNQQLLYIAQEYLEQGIPGAGVDTIEYVRDDGFFTYYRIRLTDGSYSKEFTVPSAGNSTNIRQFGAVGDGVTDDAPAFRAAAAYAKANGPLTVYVPKGNYRFIVADVIPSISSGCCVPMDGVSDFHIVGRAGANILIEANSTRVNAFTHYVSSESATAQQWSQRNVISGLTFKYTRAVGFVGSFTGILMLGCEDSEVSNNKFDYTAALGGSFGTNGSGKNNKYLNNVFKGVATCFDMSHCEDCTFEGNRCIGSTNAVGAFAHFYDLNTVDDIRMETPFSQAISSGNLFTGNTVQGYPSAFSLRGIRDSWVVDNRIHSFQANDSTVRNMISLYTESREFGLVPSQHTRGIIVSRNVIYGVNNTGGGQTRGIFINQFGGTYPVSDVTISHNMIHDMPNGVGISYDHTPRNWSVFGNVIDATTVGTPYGREGIALAVPSAAGFSPEINVTGDVDLILRPGPTRFVRFGTTTPNSDAPVTGYITIRDLAGVARKLAVIS